MRLTEPFLIVNPNSNKLYFLCYCINNVYPVEKSHQSIEGYIKYFEFLNILNQIINVALDCPFLIFSVNRTLTRLTSEEIPKAEQLT